MRLPASFGDDTVIEAETSEIPKTVNAERGKMPRKRPAPSPVSS
jgi:hypothetical protein